MMWLSYSLIAVLCYVEEPDVCWRASMGSASSFEMCRRMVPVAYAMPPRGTFVKKNTVSCASGGVDP